jgi:hypothetical protein
VFSYLSHIAANRTNVKIISFANEGIFNGAETNIPALRAFIFARNDMNYPIYIDTNWVAFNGEPSTFVP